MIALILLQVPDAFWANLPTLVTAIVGAVLSLLAFLRAGQAAKKSSETALKVDGLLEQKTLADKALGRIEGIDTAAKEKAIGDARELQAIKEQQLLHQPPPSIKSDVKEVKDEIVKTIESKGDETQKVVEKIPDEVVKKLPPQ